MRTSAISVVVLLLPTLAGCAAGLARGPDAGPYRGAVQTLAADAAEGPAERVRGVVFEDRNRDGRRQPEEPGIPGVLVSNGLEVVRTGDDGAYALPVREDMAVFVIKPAGFAPPVDARFVPQFAYQHKPAGSAKPLRYGGLPPTGPLPEAIHFPLVRSPEPRRFACAVIGDSQTYTNTEVGYFRDSLVAELLRDGPGHYDCLLYAGDVMGDDLGLLPRLLEVAGVLEAPQYLTHGNHDFDFDAPDDADSADSWRRLYGPAYYAFEFGEVLFVVLDNVVYPCGPEDAVGPGRAACGNPERPTYNGRVTETQLRWLENLLALVPRERLVVLTTHIPLVSFYDAHSARHQTDDAARLHALLAGRPALSLAGHTHTTENLAPGEHFAGWREAAGVGPLPFRHLIAGAASGAWYHGDYDRDGVPMALQRMGAPRGFLRLDFDGTEYVESYFGTGMDRSRQMWLSLSTPDFRAWYRALTDWRGESPTERDPLPPVNLHDLPDTKLITPGDLAAGVFLTANVWLGSRETEVSVRIDDAPPQRMVRTQEGEGEAPRIGVDYADPFAARHQLQIARHAYQSRSGDPRSQGYAVFRGRQHGPAAPQPAGPVADRNMHLWRLRLPEDLPPGTHVASVTATDRHGRTHAERLLFEVRLERPPAHWRGELWE
jgi:hypothetical protein